VLVITMLILVLTTLIGISAMTSSNIEIQIAQNEKRHKTVFYAADAGIQVGRAVLNDLKAADSGNWDNLLSGNQIIAQLDGATTLDQVIANAGGGNVGLAAYNLEVSDNDDLDGDPQVDTDNIIVLRSTGTYLNAKARIKAQVRYEENGDQYSQEHHGPNNSGHAAKEDAVVADIQRW
jgi:Tfp pilus assembly protein PilX